MTAGPSAATAVVGVIGDPVAHSLSPRLHNAAFRALGIDWVSVGFPVAAGSLAPALSGMAALGIRGLSVTMPHKSEAARLVSARTPIAELLGAVNCVWSDGGGIRGDNTDGAGLLAALARQAGFDPAGRRCLVVGAGGAARAVVAALAGEGAEVVVVNRSPEPAARAAALAGADGRVGVPGDAATADLVVNATPLGMRPGDALPLEPGLVPDGALAVDLIYHPSPTPWLGALRSRGVEALDGLGMLVHQAALQIERWTGLAAPVDAMWRAVVDAPGPGPGRH